MSVKEVERFNEGDIRIDTNEKRMKWKELRKEKSVCVIEGIRKRVKQWNELSKSGKNEEGIKREREREREGERLK